MATRGKRGKFTEADIDQQLQQIHLLDPASTSENLEQLGPLIKNIYATRQQDSYLKTLRQLTESKEAEIQQICGDNYQDFVTSVSTMLNVRSSTNTLRDRIISLDDSVNQAGRALAEKKKGLLKAKKAAMNLDEAIETMQACLRLLDLVNRIGELIRQGKYYSALRVSHASNHSSSSINHSYSHSMTSKLFHQVHSPKHPSLIIYYHRYHRTGHRLRMLYQPLSRHGSLIYEMFRVKLVVWPWMQWKCAVNGGRHGRRKNRN